MQEAEHAMFQIITVAAFFVALPAPVNAQTFADRPFAYRGSACHSRVEATHDGGCRWDLSAHGSGRLCRARRCDRKTHSEYTNGGGGPEAPRDRHAEAKIISR